MTAPVWLWALPTLRTTGIAGRGARLRGITALTRSTQETSPGASAAEVTAALMPLWSPRSVARVACGSSGEQVFFDNVAPLLYVSATQIKAIAPYLICPRLVSQVPSRIQTEPRRGR
jgi:hypothetical protein